MLETRGAPIYKNHDLDFKKIRAFMGVQQEALAHLIDVSPSTLRNARVSVETRTKATLIVKIIHHLWELSEHNEAKACRWLREPKERLLGLTPIEFMQMNPKINIPIVEEDLRRQLYGEAMGA